MAKIPTPRSRSQILGDMYDTFKSRTGVTRIMTGSPVLSVFDAAAQSDLRSTQDTFQLLAADGLDKAEGTGLDRRGADEDRPRVTQAPSSGFVTIGDSAFVKKTSKIYQGQGAPIVGADKLYVSDAFAFPSAGSVYVGRGTTNYEGPLLYTAATNLGTYWRLDLDPSTHTTKFHNLAEIVTLAQGGNRNISAGTIVQTPQGNVSAAIQFGTLYSAVIPDGEVSVERVTVIAQKPGLIGNIPAGSISAFVTKPFSTATVTNPLPYTNAVATEDDKTYREAIRAVRKSKTKGTRFAIENSVFNKFSAAENKRISSAAYVIRKDKTDTLYIDDGTGYEEQTSGNPLETLTDSAIGGEEDFQVAAPRPVSKAFVQTVLSAPFSLAAGMALAVKVGGVLSQHAFSASEFQSIDNAGAYEVVASINANASLLFSARTASSGTKVAIFAKTDTGEDIEVVTADGRYVDSNTFLGFSSGKSDTLLLYKNDRLLSKDGQSAIALTQPQSAWGSMSGSQTLLISVDGTPVITVTFADVDFVNARTGYASLSTSNSLEAWAAVFNALIPGVTTTVTSGKLTLTSNLGPSARAGIKITGGSLVSNGKMFVFNTSVGLIVAGRARDYTFNRNTGLGRLLTPLVLGETLTLGSSSTRAFIESTAIPATTLASNAELWFVVDGEATIISTGLTSSAAVNITKYDPTPDTTWGERVRVTATAGTPLTNVQVGDWALMLDTGFNAANRGAWRVDYVDAGFTYFEISKAALIAESGTVLNHGGIVFVRSSAQVQKITVPTGANYTAATIADSINTSLLGATAEVYKTNRYRVRTNTLDISGNIALVAQNTAGAQLGLTIGDAVYNLNTHLAAVQSGNSEDGTPYFLGNKITAVASTTQFTASSASGVASNSILKMTRVRPDVDSSAARSRYGTNTGRRLALHHASGTTLVTRVTPIVEWLPDDRFISTSPFALCAQDDLTLVVDNDSASHRYSMTMYRKTTPTTSTYGAVNALTDSDNAGLSLAAGFGTGFIFNDFAAFMRSRVKSHAEGGVDTTKTILWRYNRYGPDGNVAKIRYTNPTVAAQGVTVSANPLTAAWTTTNAETALWEGNTLISVGLPSGALRTGYTIRNGTKVGTIVALTGGGNRDVTYILGYSITSAVRVVKLDFVNQTVNFTVGQIVTGVTSAATGTIQSQVDAGATGTLTLVATTGTFVAGEALTDPLGGTGTSNGLPRGETTLTLDIAAPGATVHGFQVGDKIWNTSSSGSFTAGPKTIIAIAATTVTYNEGTNSVVATPNIGTVSFDALGEAKLNGSTIVSGDIASFTSISGLPALYQQAVRINTLGNQFLRGRAEAAVGAYTVPVWSSIANVAGVSFFPISTTSNTAAQIAAAVNVLAAATNSTCPVTAVAVGAAGVATGQISQASFDEFDTPGYSYSLSDGINWIQTHTTPANTGVNFNFTFKDATAAGLATNSDWANEDVRLVPVTAKNAVDYMNTLAVSGLASAAEVSTNNEFGNVGISSLTVGSDGSIEVQGGNANSASASILGSALTIGSYMVGSLKAAEVLGFTAGMWADISNTNRMPKSAFTGSTSCTSIDALGNFIISGTQAWTYANTATGQINGFPWQIEKHGRYTAYVFTGVGAAPVLTGIKENDWVVIATSVSAGYISSGNTGTFRIVRCDTTNNVFWIENPNSVVENMKADLWFLTADSIMPGDTLAIGTTLWGQNNKANWTVKALDSTSVFKFSVDISTQAITAFTGPVALGTQSSLVQCIEANTGKLIKQIRSISTDPIDGTLVNMKFETNAGVRNVGAVAGSLVRALDKFAFPTTIAKGIDGYRNSTGLMAEASRILYGDERDPSTYPGVVAGGANVNLSGALIKRIRVALAIRIQSNATAADVIRRVQSAVAAVINGTPQGRPIAIVDICDAAKSVNGVIAVTPLSPALSAGNDLISVQSYEKPLVVNLEQDVSVSLVGE